MNSATIGIIIEHFQHPRNTSEIENADGCAVIGDPPCSDFIKVCIWVKDETICDFKYKVFGCWGAIYTTSVVSELAIGKSLKEKEREHIILGWKIEKVQH